MSCLLDKLKVTVQPGKPWNISEMFIVLWPITAKMRTRKLATKPQTNQRSCLQFSFFTSDWLFFCNTITFQKYFWFARFSQFDCNSEKCTYRSLSSSLQEIHFIRNKHIQIERNRINLNSSTGRKQHEATENKSSAKAGLESGNVGLQIRRTDHSTMLPPNSQEDRMAKTCVLDCNLGGPASSPALVTTIDLMA